MEKLDEVKNINKSENNPNFGKTLYSDSSLLTSEKFNFYYSNVLKEYFYKNDKKEFDDKLFETFLDKMKEKLPCVFRLNKANIYTKGNFIDLISDQKKLDENYNLTELGVEVKEIKLTSNCSGVYNINLPKLELKKNVLLKKFHKFIQYSVDAGLISRQEAVSMIPPLILNVSKKDKVLDMCAAPGSKTGQFLEILYQDCNYFKNEYNGFVLANDNHITRAYMMTHQLQRFNTSDLLVVNHDSQNFPIINKDQNEIKFDKILADVPCSSDAVMRKLPHMWKKWSPITAFQLHKTQLNILIKGVSLLKIGGDIVYSTCSLNPTENEAVVAELLRLYPTQLEIVNCSHLFENDNKNSLKMKVRQGLVNWDVYLEQQDDRSKLVKVDKNSELHLQYKQLIPDSCFNCLEDKNLINQLRNCVRIFPHDSDTSGFFITLIRKISEISYADKKDKNANSNNDTLNAHENLKNTVDIKVKGGIILKDYGICLLDKVKNEKELNWLKNYYGLADDFPFCQLASHSDKSRKLNFISPSVYDFIKSDVKQKLKIITVGVRMFEQTRSTLKEDMTCLYRVCQSGVSYLLPYMNKRICYVDISFFILLLKTGSMRTDLIKECNNELYEVLDKMSDESIGSMVVVCVKNKLSNYNREELEINYLDVLCCYLSKTSLTFQISQEFQHMFSIKYGIEVKPFVYDKLETKSKESIIKEEDDNNNDNIDNIDKSEN